ncbi:MAG: hypothetical protein FJZ63_04830 [Chlamydiae bacterium]|nr:hypothetical protein [Chlamydiota bacterium]
MSQKPASLLVKALALDDPLRQKKAQDKAISFLEEESRLKSYLRLKNVIHFISYAYQQENRSPET